MKMSAVRRTLSRWKPYPSYKDSGVEWVGGVPVQWTVLRLRFCLKNNPSKSELDKIPRHTSVSFVPMDNVGEYGGLRLDKTKLLDEVSTGYTYFRNGDVVVARITPCFENYKGAIAESLENGIGFGTTELHVLRPLGRLDGHFLFYLTLSHAFRHLGASYMYGAGGQKRVPDEFIQDFRQPIPPINEQQTIVDFLNRETAKIDALVLGIPSFDSGESKLARMILLLREYRSALISAAVTGKIDVRKETLHE